MRLFRNRKPPRLRVRRFTVRQVEYGYTTPTVTTYQALEQKRWWGWSRVDVEEVPQAVLIAIGALGYDNTGWESKFMSYGHFGRDGIITPRSAT